MAPFVPIPHPNFQITPRIWPTFAGGYIHWPGNGSLHYSEFGSYQGWPDCPGLWSLEVSASISSSLVRAAYGYTPSSGFTVQEYSTGGTIFHQEWACSTAVNMDTGAECGQELATVPFQPDEVPLVPRLLDPAWSVVSAAYTNTSKNTVEVKSLAPDLRVNALRGGYSLGTPPFTGRVFVETTNPYQSGLRTADYLLGRCIQTEASQYGGRDDGAVIFHPESVATVKVGLTVA